MSKTYILQKWTRIPRNAVSRLPTLFHKIEVNLKSDALAYIIGEKQEPNFMQMLQNWSKGNINCEIQLYCSRALKNPGLIMALALIALEKQR